MHLIIIEKGLDISGHGFRQASQIAFLDVRLSSPNAKRYTNIELSKGYVIKEKEEDFEQEIYKRRRHMKNAFFRSSMDVSQLW